MGMRIAVLDRDAEKLASTAGAMRSAGAAGVITSGEDVSDRAQLETLEQQVTDRFGGTDIWMNNAGVGGKS